MDFLFQSNHSFFSPNEPAVFLFEFSVLFIATVVVSATTCLEIGLLLQKQALKRGELVETEEEHLKASISTGELFFEDERNLKSFS